MQHVISEWRGGFYIHTFTFPQLMTFVCLLVSPPVCRCRCGLCSVGLSWLWLVLMSVQMEEDVKMVKPAATTHRPTAMNAAHLIR